MAPGASARQGWGRRLRHATAYGDVYPANTPYVITSQGSSGSDQVFLSAVACTLAAFRPETKELLVRTGTLMPTVQRGRELATALTARAMLHLAEGRSDAAWQNLLACHRLGRHVARGSSLS